jgi:hypothetical protein
MLLAESGDSASAASLAFGIDTASTQALSPRAAGMSSSAVKFRRPIESRFSWPDAFIGGRPGSWPL